MAIMRIPVPKAKGQFVEIDTSALGDEMYAEAVYQGLKQMIGRGFSKIGKAQYPVEAELSAAAVAKADDNVKAILASDTKTIKPTGTPKGPKVSGAINTEAMRLARNLVKDQIKAQGLKISHYEAAEITKAAKVLIENDPSIVEMATANLAERAKKIEGTAKVDIASIIAASPKLIAAAEAKKKGSGTLSAKQAGKTATRQKPAKAQPEASTLIPAQKAPANATLQ